MIGYVSNPRSRSCGVDGTSPALCHLLPLFLVPFQVVLGIYQEVMQSFSGGKRAGRIPRFEFLLGTKVNVLADGVVGSALETQMCDGWTSIP